MAPEIIGPVSRLQAATFEDLKRIDVWAFGMVLFNLLNPDMKYPYQLDIRKGSTPEEATQQMQDLIAKKKLPTTSAKYKDFQSSVWYSIVKTSERCLEFKACLRPTAKTLKDTFQALLCQETTVQIEEGCEGAHKEKPPQITSDTRLY